MAQKVIVQLVDDLDGSQSDDVSPVTFGLDGATYEIDLTSKNASSLREQLADYIASARRAGGRIKRGTVNQASSNPMSREQSQAIRGWARKNGYKVSDRGRLADSLIKAFEAAQTAATTKSRPRKTNSSGPR